MTTTASRNNMAKRQAPRSMYCPVCPKPTRIIDIAPGLDASSIMLYAAEDCRDAHFFVKCGRCKSQVAIRFAQKAS